jgi:hypothetical protein
MSKVQEQNLETPDKAIFGRARMVFDVMAKEYAVLAVSAENAIAFAAFLSWSYRQLQNGVEIDDLGMAGLGIMVEVLGEQVKTLHLG